MASHADGVATVPLEERIEQLLEERGQLRHALESRMVIEQAKGVLAERYELTVDDAFFLLRRSARSARVRIHDLAAEVVHSRETPQAVLREMTRDSRLRATAMRDRSEATSEPVEKLQTPPLSASS